MRKSQRKLEEKALIPFDFILNKPLERKEEVYDIKDLYPVSSEILEARERRGYILPISVYPNSSRILHHPLLPEQRIDVNIIQPFGRNNVLFFNGMNELEFYENISNSGISIHSCYGEKFTEKIERISTDLTFREKRDIPAAFKGTYGKLPLILAIKRSSHYDLLNLDFIASYSGERFLTWRKSPHGKLSRDALDRYIFRNSRIPNEEEIGKFWDHCIDTRKS